MSVRVYTHPIYKQSDRYIRLQIDNYEASRDHAVIEANKGSVPAKEYSLWVNDLHQYARAYKDELIRRAKEKP